MTGVLSPEIWRRAGQGGRREFPALRPEEVGEVFVALPVDLGPYRLVKHELVPGSGGYVPDAYSVDAARLAELVADGHWDYFIVSERLSLNGAVNLQVGVRNRLGPQAPSLGIMTKVATQAGESRTHDEYNKIYEAAVRAARRLSG